MTDVGTYEKISAKEFEKLQLRVGQIKKVTPHPKKPTDYIIIVDCATADEDLQVVAGLTAYKPEELVGKQIVVLCNIEPEMIEGEESQGLILISHAKEKPVLISPCEECPPGAKVWGIMNGERAHFDEREH